MISFKQVLCERIFICKSETVSGAFSSIICKFWAIFGATDVGCQHILPRKTPFIHSIFSVEELSRILFNKSLQIHNFVCFSMTWNSVRNCQGDQFSVCCDMQECLIFETSFLSIHFICRSKTMSMFHPMHTRRTNCKKF